MGPAFRALFDLGLALRPADFRLLAERPKAVFVGLTGQILLLPLIAWAVASGFHLAPLFFLGVMLIACSPGGSSSNVFSMLAGGDVALSVSLTAFSSIITLFTGPLVMDFATDYVGTEMSGIHLPVGNLLVQNLVLMAVPIAIGLAIAVRNERLAELENRIRAEFSEYQRIALTLASSDVLALDNGQKELLGAQLEALDEYAGVTNVEDYIRQLKTTAGTELYELANIDGTAVGGWTQDYLLYAVQDAVLNPGPGTVQADVQSIISGTDVTLISSAHIGSEEAEQRLDGGVKMTMDSFGNDFARFSESNSFHRLCRKHRRRQDPPDGRRQRPRSRKLTGKHGREGREHVSCRRRQHDRHRQCGPSSDGRTEGKCGPACQRRT